jgi:CTP synthase
MFCHVGEEQVLGVHDVSSVYHVPLLLESQGIVDFFRGRLNLDQIKIPEHCLASGKELSLRWKDLTRRYVFTEN